jgi:5-methylcytosine-specific restriction endonuclease McrA
MAWRRRKPLKSNRGLAKRKKGALSKLGQRLDWLVSQVTKYRDGWRCQHCGKAVSGSDAQCAHVMPKSSGIILRWNPQNTILLCFHDHIQWAHLNPVEFMEWFQAKFPERFTYLQSMRHFRAKFDEEARRAMMAHLEEELRKLGGCP